MHVIGHGYIYKNVHQTRDSHKAKQRWMLYLGSAGRVNKSVITLMVSEEFLILMYAFLFCTRPKKTSSRDNGTGLEVWRENREMRKNELFSVERSKEAIELVCRRAVFAIQCLLLMLFEWHTINNQQSDSTLWWGCFYEKCWAVLKSIARIARLPPDII